MLMEVKKISMSAQNRTVFWLPIRHLSI